MAEPPHLRPDDSPTGGLDGANRRHRTAPGRASTPRAGAPEVATGRKTASQCRPPVGRRSRQGVSRKFSKEFPPARGHRRLAAGTSPHLLLDCLPISGAGDLIREWGIEDTPASGAAKDFGVSRQPGRSAIHAHSAITINHQTIVMPNDIFVEARERRAAWARAVCSPRHSFRVESSLEPGARRSRQGGDCDVGYAEKGRPAGTAGRRLPGWVGAARPNAGDRPKHAQGPGPGGRVVVGKTRNHGHQRAVS